MTSAQHEQAVVIQGGLPTPMLGVLHIPDKRCSGTGVVIVNGGAQYRAGAHRLFVHLARHLATSGHAVLRFDLPGQGDSPGEPASFEDTAAHIGAAIDALHREQTGLERATLLGLCDGASACLLYLHVRSDERVRQLILLNPWVHDETIEARAQVRHYYRQRILMPDFWCKLIRGGIGLTALQELMQKWILSQDRLEREKSESFQDHMGIAWRSFAGHILLVLSQQDQVAQEFRMLDQEAGVWASWRSHQGLTMIELANADHTFSTKPAQTVLFRHIAQALER